MSRYDLLLSTTFDRSAPPCRHRTFSADDQVNAVTGIAYDTLSFYFLQLMNSLIFAIFVIFIVQANPFTLCTDTLSFQNGALLIDASVWIRIRSLGACSPRLQL